jgi:hypothetical protein
MDNQQTKPRRFKGRPVVEKQRVIVDLPLDVYQWAEEEANKLGLKVGQWIRSELCVRSCKK